jgi:hypothetical protein
MSVSLPHFGDLTAARSVRLPPDSTAANTDMCRRHCNLDRGGAIQASAEDYSLNLPLAHTLLDLADDLRGTALSVGCHDGYVRCLS